MIRPLRDLVVVEELPDPTTEGSVLVIRADRPKLVRGRVLAVGPRQTLVGVGDIVLWPKRFGRPVDTQDKTDSRVILESDWIEGVEE